MYERVAAEVRAQIASGELPLGTALPTHKQLAEQYGISAGTAHRVTALLASEGLVEVSRGRRATVIRQPPPDIDSSADPADPPSVSPPAPALPNPVDIAVPGTVTASGRRLLDLEIRRLGRIVKRLTTEADPRNARELRQVLVDAITRDGGHESQIAEYEMDIRGSGESLVLTTFAATARRI